MIRWKGILSLGVSALFGLCAISCNQSNTADLQNLQLTNLQISSFSIASTKDASLAQYTFSVDHNQALIENKTPLPYGYTLDSITLGVTASASSDVNVAIKLGETGEYSAWNKTQTYSLGNDVREIFVKVSPKVDNATNASNTGLSHVYRVKLHQYSYDPETISWQEMVNVSIPLASASDYLYSLPLYDANGSTTGVSYIGISNSGTSSLYSYDNTSTIATLNTVDMSGIASGAHIVQVEQNTGYVYALDSEGTLYSLSGTTWSPISGLSVSTILGILSPRNSNSTPTLAVISKNGRFATYNVVLGYNESSVSVPSTFPFGYNTDGVYRKSFASTTTHEGSKLLLIACSKQGAAYTRSVWYTTDGSDWAKIHTNNTLSAYTSAGFTLLDGLYYHIQSTANGLEVYSSSDEGVTWSLNSSVALPRDTESFASAPISVWSYKTGKLYIYRGINESSPSNASIWVGTLQKDVSQ